MDSKFLFQCRVVLLSLPVVSVVYAGNLNVEEINRLSDEGKILPLEQIINEVSKVRPGRLIEVELEKEHQKYVYEFEILDNQGTVWELEVDAATGKTLEMEKDN